MKEKTPTSANKIREDRYFVLDTNVLLHDVNALTAFKCVVVAIPFTVLEELDKFKKESGEMGHNAREVIRTIDAFRSKGSLRDGVMIPCDDNEYTILKVLPYPLIFSEPFLDTQLADNVILQTIHDLIESGFHVTFITKDINARVKADALGIEAEDYTKGTITKDEVYKGWEIIQLPARELRMISTTNLPELTKKIELPLNKYIVIESENNPENYRLFRFLGGKNFREVAAPQLHWNFSARNVQQLMALDLLLDDDIKLLSLLGPAGTGKTFLTILTGLEKVAREKVYRRFLVTRPIVPLGADIGYLPGDVQEKLLHWMMPIRDNLEYIFTEEAKGRPSDEDYKKKSKKIN